MGRFSAKLISYILHPIWMPMYVVLLFWAINSHLNVYSNASTWIYILIVVLLNSILIPVVLFWMMKKLQVITSLQMESRSDRFYPFLITGIFYLTSWFVFHRLGVFDLVSYMFLLAFILVILSLLITFVWKISIHSVSMGALSVFIIYLCAVKVFDSSWPAYGIVFLSGLVGFARIKLKSHTGAQVYAGYLLGAAITVLSLMAIV